MGAQKDNDAQPQQTGLFGQYGEVWPQPKTIWAMLIVGGEYTDKLSHTHTANMEFWLTAASFTESGLRQWKDKGYTTSSVGFWIFF